MLTGGSSTHKRVLPVVEKETGCHKANYSSTRASASHRGGHREPFGRQGAVSPPRSLTQPRRCLDPFGKLVFLGSIWLSSLNAKPPKKKPFNAQNPAGCAAERHKHSRHGQRTVGLIEHGASDRFRGNGRARDGATLRQGRARKQKHSLRRVLLDRNVYRTRNA